MGGWEKLEGNQKSPEAQRPVRRGPMILPMTVSAAAVMAAACWWWLSRRPAAVPSGPVAGHAETANDQAWHQINPGYLGPQVCGECHADRLSMMESSRHFRTCRVPEAQAMPVGFGAGRGNFSARNPRLRFEMTRDGDDFFGAAIQRTSVGEQRATSRLDLVLGAGFGDDVYLTWHAGNRLCELPVVWLHASGEWAASHVDPHRGGDFSRDTSVRCMECHNTWFSYVPGTGNQYHPQSFIRGVTCERCHGPGNEHAAHHREHPEEAAGQKIIHPGRLSRDRQLEVCTQCHSNAMKPRGPFLRYRPGEPLESYYVTHVTSRNEDDHVANQIQYLRESKCFQNSDTLTCTTCHDPHRPRQAADSGPLRASCLRCHEPAACGDQPHLPAAVRDKCVDCHMPAYVKINVNFQTKDDDYVPPLTRSEHRIAVYPAARKAVLWEWHRAQSDRENQQAATRLAKSLVDHWLAEAEDCRRQYRYLGAIAAIREAARFDSGSEIRAELREAVAIQQRLDADWFDAIHHFEERRFSQAIEGFRGLLKLKPDMALVHGKLGTAYAVNGQRKLAAEHLRKVAECDPYDAYGEALLGWLAYLDQRYDDSLEAYRRAAQIEPYESQIQFRMGLALARLDRVAEAIEHFRLALEIEPQRPDVCTNLIAALRAQRRAPEAVEFAEHAARLTGWRDIDVLMTLAETYGEAGRYSDALNSAQKALELATTNKPNMLEEIRRRLEAIQARAAAAEN
jgi:tetratricopeptide (TPR) repeat protein